ncbi:MAG: hypothetical protein AB7Q16_18880 [Vicinamibacterales bacterium]
MTRSVHAGVMRTLALLLALVLAAPSTAAAQATLIPPEYCAYDLNGNPLVGGTLTSYVAGTSTALALYTDFALTTPHSNPLTLDGRGCVVAYMQPASYRFVLRDSGGTQVYDVTIVSSPALHTVNLDIAATAGETLAAGSLVFLADGSGGTTAGRWHLTDADTVSKSSGARIVGMSLAAMASGATGTVRVQGRVTGLSGLTAGAPYYASATAGALAATPPTNRRFAGVAESSSTFVLATGIVEAAEPVLLSLSVAGNATVGGTLGVTGAVTGGTYNGQTISSAASLTGTLAVAGAVTGGTYNGQTISSAASLTGTLAVAGATTLSGVATVNAANNRGLVITRASADAGLTITSTGGSGTAYALVSESSSGAFRVQHDSDGNPRVVLYGSANTIELAATGGVENTTFYKSATEQPGFLARNSVADSQTLPFTLDVDDEVYDEGGDFAADTFTAPVTGRYLACVTAQMFSWSTSMTASLSIVTSNRSYLVWSSDVTASSSRTGSGCQIVDMDASDTLYAQVGGTSGQTVSVAVDAWLSVRLLP